MKILLAQNSPYTGAYGGANKANRYIVEALAARGHECAVIAPAMAGQEDAESPTVSCLQGVQVWRVSRLTRTASVLPELLGLWKPEWTLIAEDPGQLLLRSFSASKYGRSMYLARNTLSLPFGSGSFQKDATASALFNALDGIVVNSQFLKQYVVRYTGVDAVVMDVPVYRSEAHRNGGRFDAGYITMINPCAIKGIGIFCAVAAKLGHLPFAAVPTWGTTKEDLRLLATVPNVRLLSPTAEITDILKQTRVLMVPSLWEETFGRIVVEAMLYGIPVLASDVGGLPEAKLGVDYLVPVRGISHYSRNIDDRLLPIPVIPEQVVDPWCDHLTTLTQNPTEYCRVSEDSRRKAFDYVAGLSIDPLERMLAG